MRATPILPTSFTSSATSINFGDLPGGDCNLCGPSVTDQYAGLGVKFNNPSFPGLDTVDTNLTPLIPGASSPNALFVDQGGMLGLAPALPFQILFSVPVTKVGIDYGSSADSFLQLDVYDTSGSLLETLRFTGDPAPIGLAGFAGVQETTSIGRLDVSYHPNSDPTRTFNFSITNLEFEGTTVPEPSSIAMIVLGLAGLAVQRQRRVIKRLRK